MPESWDRVVAILRRGGVIACPTETFVGLLADAHQPSAIERVMQIKGRDATHSLALLIPDVACMSEWIEPLSGVAQELADQHWPGPLTLVVLLRKNLHPALVKDGKVGIRVPGPSPALEIARVFGGPLTATSANLTGDPAVTDTQQLDPRIVTGVDAVVPGRSSTDLPSTIVDVSTGEPVVLRQGAAELQLLTRG